MAIFKKLTSSEERRIRMKSYDKERHTFKDLAKRPRLNLSMFDDIHIPVPTASEKIRNFKQFVKENFASDMDDGAWPDGSITGIKLYTYLEKYSKTKEGSIMIVRILQNNKISERTKKPIFQVKYTIGKGGQQAIGGFNWIWFGDKFAPKGKKFPGGELVDPISVINHELGHTRFYNKAIITITIGYERANVIFNENPMRKRRGFDYRYTYYQRGINKTINIITNDKKTGVWTILKTDPKKLVPPGSLGALI